MGDADMIYASGGEYGARPRWGAKARESHRATPRSWAVAGRRGLLVLLFAGVVTSGCRSAPPVTATQDSSPEPAAAEATEASEAPATAPLELTGIQVREGAPGSRVELTSNEPLVWTSFRDMEGRVVVELPNAVPGPGVADLEPANELVERITVSQEPAGRRPITRLVISTREDVEHTLRADGNLLTLELEPTAAVADDRGGNLTFEPIAEPEHDLEPELGPMALADEPLEESPAAERGSVLEPVAPETPAPRPERVGTPEAPLVGPAPAGAAASTLNRVEIASAGEMTTVEIRGDGEFAYSTFRLSDPPRFVVDLAGVVNLFDRSAVSVGRGVVEQVRVAQFKSRPDPVTRVVVDLREEDQPRIERTPDTLVLRFDGDARPERVPVAAARPYPAPVPAERPQPRVPVVTGEPEPEDRAPAPMERAQDVEITNEPAGEPVIEVERPPLPPPAPSDATLYGAEEVRLERPADVRDERGLVFENRQVSGEREYFGEPIDMSLKDADVVETVRSFAQISGLNIVVQPEVEGRVTVELHDVPWDQALEQILRINALGYEIEGNIMRIAPLPLLRAEAQERQQLVAAQALSVPLETVMKRLSYTSARNLAGILRRGGGATLLSQRGSVIVDERTNTLIISELPEYMDTILAIIDNLDEPEPQVMIEARIIETTKRFSRELGISWGVDFTAGAATGNTTGIEFPNNISGGGAVELGTPGNAGMLELSLGNILNTVQLDLALNAAEEDGLVNILSTPKVATLNNRQATIQSGLQVPIQTVANNTVTVQFVNATLRLEVTPQITADGTVVMDIHIQKREVQTAFLQAGATNAPIATKEARTQVLVRDGGTAVIGGIYEVATDQSQNRVPGLASIPIIGHLFRNNTRTDENEELLIFITPRVVRL